MQWSMLSLFLLLVAQGTFIDCAPQSEDSQQEENDNGIVPGYGISANANVNVVVNIVQPGTAPDPDIPSSLLVSSSGPAGTVQLGAMGLYRLTDDVLNDRRTWRNKEDFIYWRNNFWCIGESYQGNVDHMCGANPSSTKVPPMDGWLFVNRIGKLALDDALTVEPI